MGSTFISERDSFEQLYEEYSPLVFKTALQILRRRSEAEDIVQTVFLKIWQRPTAFRSGNIQRWLVVVTRNASVDMIRERRRLTSAPVQEWLLGSESAVEDEVMRIVAGCEVRSELKKLPSSLQALLVASYWNRLAHPSIAIDYALPLGTVKTRIRRGLATLRKSLDGVA